jgi:hypothetical protein
MGGQSVLRICVLCRFEPALFQIVKMADIQSNPMADIQSNPSMLNTITEVPVLFNSILHPNGTIHYSGSK